MNRKRILAWLLTLAMIVSLFPAAAFAAEQPANAEDFAIVEEAAEDAGDFYVVEDEAEIAFEEDAEEAAIVEAANEGEIDLEITNNTGMFKAETAYLTEEGGKTYLVMALSGSGYHELFKGTYEEAVANGDGSADKGNDSWIHGYENAAGKWEFKIPIEEGETYVPCVAVSNSYYEKFLAGTNSLARAFYPRQFELDKEAKTLVTGDYAFSQSIAVTNNVSMFRPAAEATLETVGGPNSNNYAANLVLPMTTASMSDVFVGTPAEAAEEGAETIAFDTEKSTFTIPVKWVETFGNPETLVTLCDGEPFVLSFKSASNGNWYGRQATLDEEAGTLVFDPWVDPTPANTVDELIAKIQIQYFTDTTWADCEAAKAAWDALSDAEKALVEEYDYFGLDTGDATKDDPLNQDEIGEKEILVVSFGTSFNDSRVATIGGVEKAVAAAFPDWSVRRAFTAQIIINHIYARDGEKIDNMDQALERAAANGVKELVVQPTHLMHGAEYDELVEALAPYQDKMEIKISEPLLGEVGADATVINEDKLAVAEAVVAAACKDAGYADAAAAAADGAAIVLMGHGTEHVANVTYEQMQAAMAQLGYANVFVGTVEGLPESTECSNVIAAVKAAGYTKVYLRPLMVVAGDHANNDMADPEDEESWLSQFTADGSFTAVTPQINGLGEIPAVQQIYVEHLKAVIPEPVVLKDGLYALTELSAGPSAMFNHFEADSKLLVVEGDTAKIQFVTDGSTASIGKYSKIALGKSSELVTTPYQAELPEGTVIIEGVEQAEAGEKGARYFFEIALPKAEVEELLANDVEEDIYIVVWNKEGSSAEKIPGWYQASNDIYLSLGAVGDYLSADYTAVDAALAKVPANLLIYTEESLAPLTEAIAAVDRTKRAEEQAAVDAMAKAIEDAVAGLIEKEITFKIVAAGEEITAIEKSDKQYDASYEDWQTGQKVESMIPLYVVKVPAGTEEVEITLNDYVNEYQTYYYTAEPDETGYTQYIGYGFGDQVDDYTYIAAADKAYTTKVDLENVIRVQSAYDASWTSYNLYAIAFENEIIPASAIELDKKTAEVAATKTLQLKATLTPAESTAAVIWESTDESIATVDQNGLVTGKKYGKTKIVATVGDLKAVCNVTVLFKDVANHGKSYFDPVYWAVNKKITSVTVEFRPDDPVNRGEFTAFLYRLAGKPKVSKITTKFSDVKSDTKFAKEITWAVNEGIINGYSNGTFKPTANITRAQVAIMLWRYAGKPNVSVKKSPFPDVELNGSDTSKAIIWGYTKGIMKGSNGKFLPKDNCTRGQVVTFMQRYDAKYPKK